jgi:hypothetical protein
MQLLADITHEHFSSENCTIPFFRPNTPQHIIIIRSISLCCMWPDPLFFLSLILSRVFLCAPHTHDACNDRRLLCFACAYWFWMTSDAAAEREKSKKSTWAGAARCIFCIPSPGDNNNFSYLVLREQPSFPFFVVGGGATLVSLFISSFSHTHNTASYFPPCCAVFILRGAWYSIEGKMLLFYGLITHCWFFSWSCTSWLKKSCVQVLQPLSPRAVYLSLCGGDRAARNWDVYFLVFVRSSQPQ